MINNIKNRTNWICYIFTGFILLQPFLDLATSLMRRFGFSVTLGIAIRAIFMVFCFLCVLFFSRKRESKVSAVYLLIVCVYCLCFLAVSFFRGGLAMALDNLRELIKTFYFIFVLFALYEAYKTYQQYIPDSALTFAIFGYTLVIFLAFVTNTSFDSYTSGKGYNGWFYAANEISAIISILGPIAILYCHKILLKKYDDTSTFIKTIHYLFAAICLILIAFCAVFIGTKVVFLGILAYIVCCTVWWGGRSFSNRTKRNLIGLGLTVLMIFAIGGLFTVSPLRANLQGYVGYHYSRLVREPIETVPESKMEPDDSQALSNTTQMNTEVATQSEGGDHPEREMMDSKLYRLLNWLLSNRLEYIQPSIQAFFQGDIVTHIFGIGYTNMPDSIYNIEKAIEMDGLAILFRHGYAGALLFLLPIAYILLKALRLLFSNIKTRLMSLEFWTYLYSLILGLCIAFFTGHTLVAPSVSIYVAVVCIRIIQLQGDVNNRIMHS